MLIEKKIKLSNNYYFVGVELKYDNKKQLCKKDNSYFDCGDLSCLIEEIELLYQKSDIYDKDIGYMNDILYIYDRIHFLSYVKDISYSPNTNQIDQMGEIKKDEIDEYIKNNGIKMGRFEGKSSCVPLLFD